MGQSGNTQATEGRRVKTRARTALRRCWARHERQGRFFETRHETTVVTSEQKAYTVPCLQTENQIQPCCLLHHAKPHQWNGCNFPVPKNARPGRVLCSWYALHTGSSGTQTSSCVSALLSASNSQPAKWNNTHFDLCGASGTGRGLLCTAVINASNGGSENDEQSHQLSWGTRFWQLSACWLRVDRDRVHSDGN